MLAIPHFLYHYDEPLRACFAVMDEFGSLVPCNSATYWTLMPEWNISLDWTAIRST